MKLLLLLALVPLAHCAGYHGHRLLSVQATTKEDLVFLDGLLSKPDFMELDFWSEPSLIRPTGIQVPPSVYGKLEAELNKSAMPFNILHNNLQAVADADFEAIEKAREGRKQNDINCEIDIEYCKYKEIAARIAALEAEFPQRVHSWSIGKTWQRRPIYAVKIVENLDGPAKPAVFLEAGTHAREWISPAVAINMIDRLARGDDAWAQQMLNKFDYYIVPVHNVDGYEFTWKGPDNRYWRKNRQPCGSEDYIGTDLNRNWDIDWGKAGVVHECWSSTFPGSGPFSAPETTALANAVANTDNVVAFISLHCFSQLMLVPYAYTSTHPERYDELMSVANHMMNALTAVDGKTFTVGAPPDILYAASGGAYDYFYDVQGVPWSFTYELRPTELVWESFHLDPSLISVSTDEVMASMAAFAGLF